MGVVVLWVGLALVAVGWPLLGRALESRAHERAAPEDSWGFKTRHGLTAAQLEAVERSLHTGRAVDDPALRPLAAERAASVLGQQPRRLSRRTRATVVVGAAGVAVVLAVTVVLWSPAGTFWPTLATTAAIGQLPRLAGRVRLRRLRQAVQSNRPAVKVSAGLWGAERAPAERVASSATVYGATGPGGTIPSSTQGPIGGPDPD